MCMRLLLAHLYISFERAHGSHKFFLSQKLCRHSRKINYCTQQKIFHSKVCLMKILLHHTKNFFKTQSSTHTCFNDFFDRIHFQKHKNYISTVASLHILHNLMKTVWGSVMKNYSTSQRARPHWIYLCETFSKIYFSLHS